MNLAELDHWLDDRHLKGMWNRQGGGDEVKPYLWKWADLYEGISKAAELVPISAVPMRTIQLKNPGLTEGMSRTLHFSVQCLNPGEKTKAHRNLTGETRFVLKASPGAVFIVDGEAFPLEEGDLVTTPNWAWHDHYNGGSGLVIWLDGMDARLVSIGKHINERFPQDHQPVEKSEGYSSTVLGHAKPSWIKHEHPTPPSRYRWSDTYSTLLALKESGGDLYDGIHLRYSHPVNGGPTLPTYSCEVQLFRPRETTRSHRHNSTTVYHVFRGEGTTVVEDQRLEWAQGDIFIIPPWQWHSHENRLDGDSILYSITDWPAMRALGLYREEKR